MIQQSDTHTRLHEQGIPHNCDEFDRLIREEQRAEEAEADEIAETRDILKAARLI
jgi:hypothetical protein